jgi:diguanylate cyclase (GGDEF)-like protein/PAS domain S-box-containing protein
MRLEPQDHPPAPDEPVPRPRLRIYGSAALILAFAACAIVSLVSLAYVGTHPPVLAALAALFLGLASLVALRVARLVRRAEAALAESERRNRILAAESRATEERYRIIFERTPAGVYRTSLDGRIVECNPAMAHVLGYDSPAEVAGRSALDLYFDGDDRERLLARLKQHGQLTNVESRLRRKDGSTLWILENVSLQPGREGEPGLIEGAMIDITDRKRAESQIEYQAYHDALTHLPNRTLFLDRLTLALAQAHRRRTGLAVLFMDLDRFKVVNDTLGHSAGDRLLQQVAGRVRRAVREGDTVARLGGDELTLLLESDAQAPQAARVAQKLLDRIALPFDVDGHRLHLTTSIGISLYPTDGTDAETLLKSADLAMYRAKEVGRNGYQLSTPELNAKALERLALENELRLALEREELVVFYQPVVSFDSGLTTGFEALVRWRHPRNGFVPPAQFIPLAEELRLEIPISEWVLRTACRQLRAWQSRSLPVARLAVNLSALHFQQVDLAAKLARMLAEADFPARLLDVEITESAAMQNLERTAAALNDLRQMGVRISLDDFGTGQASLSHLKRFPLDTLKIDRDFVRDIGASRGGEAIVRATVEMAHGLGLRAVAEGVETTEQFDFLLRHGCDEYQGYLFSAPVAAEAIEETLARLQPQITA